MGKGTPAGRAKKVGRPKMMQPSLRDVMVQVMRGKNKPMSVDDIFKVITKGKLYASASKSLKNNLRVHLYRNEKGFFRKVDRGIFELKEKPVEKKPSARASSAPAKKAKPSKPVKTRPAKRASKKTPKAKKS